MPNKPPCWSILTVQPESVCAVAFGGEHLSFIHRGVPGARGEGPLLGSQRRILWERTVTSGTYRYRRRGDGSVSVELELLAAPSLGHAPVPRQGGAPRVGARAGWPSWRRGGPCLPGPRWTAGLVGDIGTHAILVPLKPYCNTHVQLIGMKKNTHPLKTIANF